MGLAPHKEFWIVFSILSSCLATNSVAHNNGKRYIIIVYIITPPPLKPGLSPKPTNLYLPEKWVEYARIWSSFYVLLALGN